MIRLTNHDDQGNWSLKGVKWENLYEGAVIDKKTYERLYAALWRLKDYEDTGLNPDRLEELKEENDWIPVDERLPEGQTRVICQFNNGDIELLWQDWESDPETLTYLADFSMMAEKKAIAWRPLPDPYLPEKDN